MEGCNLQPEDQRHRRSHGCQARAWGAAESRGQGQEGERDLVGNKGELRSSRVKVSLCPLFFLAMKSWPVAVPLQLFHEDGECWVYDEPLLKRLAASKHWGVLRPQSLGWAEIAAEPRHPQWSRTYMAQPHPSSCSGSYLRDTGLTETDKAILARLSSSGQGLALVAGPGSGPAPAASGAGRAGPWGSHSITTVKATAVGAAA